jgi:hypothetical protein
VLLTERISGQSERESGRQALDGLYDAVRELADGGIDVQPLLDRLVKPPAAPRRRAATRRGSGGVAPVPAELPPGFRRVRGLLVADWVDPRCISLLQFYPVLLSERLSGQNVKAVCRQVVDGLYDAARNLADEGVDVRPLLEGLGKARLRRRLETDAVRLLTENPQDPDRPLRHSFLLVDDFAEQGLLLALVTGPATKVDAHMHGPAVDWLAGQVRAFLPAVIFAREWERWGRDPWAFVTLAHAIKEVQTLRAQPVFGGDRFEHLQEMGDGMDSRLFAAGARGKREAAQLQARTSGGSRQKTGTRMENGRVPYATHVPAPPGMATALVLPGAFDAVDAEAARAARRPAPPPDSASTAIRYLYFDTPSCRPDPDLVLHHRAPLAPHGGNVPIDQVALVRWFLAHLGAPAPDGEWGLRACAARLAEGGYVTDGLRKRHKVPYPTWNLAGVTAAQSQVGCRVLTQSILGHLEWYRTGVIDVGLSGAPGQRAIITNVVPPGGWGTEADFARIEAYLARIAPARRSGAHVLTGLAMTLDGAPTRLEASSHGPLRYYQVRADGKRAGSRARRVPPMFHQDLVAMFVKGLLAGGELPRLRSDAPDGTTEARLEAERHAATVARLQATNDRRMANLSSGVLDGRVAADLGAQYNATTEQIIQAEARLAQARRVLLQAEHPPLTGVAEGDLMALVAALADPHSEQARELVHEGLRLHAELVSEPGRADRPRLRVAGDLLVHNASGTWRVPVSGEFRHKVTSRVNPHVEQGVDGLRLGRPLWESLGPEFGKWAPRVREALGLAGASFRLARVDDPRLLALGMAVVFPPADDPGSDPEHPRLAGPPLDPVALEALARANGEPLVLLARIRAVHTQASSPRPRWLNTNSPVVAEAFALASAATAPRPGRGKGAVRGKGAARASGTLALPFTGGTLAVLTHGPFAQEWSFAAGAAQLQSCAHCHRSSRVPLRLRESTGSVCAHCRTDRAGVVWPVEYDRYRHRAA